MIKHFSVFLFLCICSDLLIAQLDYNAYLEQYPLTCQKMDSASVIQSQVLLDSLAKYEIISGKDQFLHHSGMTYYLRYAKWKDRADLEKSMNFFKKGYQEFGGSGFAWECCHLSQLYGDCDAAFEYADQYEKLCKEEGIEVRYKQLYYVLRNCRN